jgi:hypothetical protein
MEFQVNVVAKEKCQHVSVVDAGRAQKQLQQARSGTAKHVIRLFKIFASIFIWKYFQEYQKRYEIIQTRSNDFRYVPKGWRNFSSFIYREAQQF